MQKLWLYLGLVVSFFGSNLTLAESDSSANTELTPVGERAGYLEPEQKKQMALADTLKEHELVWLDVSYPEMTGTRKVLAIAHPPLIAAKQGAILLVHDKEQHADWPEVIRPLRKHLPKAGWYTLSVNLPDDSKIQLPERALGAKAFDQVVMSSSLKQSLESGVRVRIEPGNNNEPQQNANSEGTSPPEVSESNGGDDNGESVDIDLAAIPKGPDFNKVPYATRSLIHIEKAYEFIQSQSYQNIVIIAYRHSAELVYQYIKAHQGELRSPGFAVIFIEPFLPEDYLLDISQWLGNGFQPPILEIINRGNQQAAHEAELRKLAILRVGTKKYKQSFLTVTNNEIYDDNLTRRIRSWLELNAPGMKIGP